jgi:hypothetical protein
MVRNIVVILAMGAWLATLTPSYSQQLLETYQARLSERDHFNSSGQRVTSAAAIIRQDRANVHRFGIRDPDDEDDSYFADPRNRELLEQLLNRGQIDPATASVILNDTPLVRVEVYKGGVGDFVIVRLAGNAEPNRSTNPDAQFNPPEDLTRSNCEELWYQRNSIYKDAGYCFKTPLAISRFGNAGCQFDNQSDVPLSDRQRQTVNGIRRVEAAKGCSSQ